MRGFADVSVRRSTALALLAQLATGLFTTVVILYLVRALGSHAFGVFSLAIVIGKLALLVADFGIPTSLGRFLAENRTDRKVVSDLLADALRLKLLSAALVSGTLFALATVLAEVFGAPELTWPLRGVALALFAESVMALYLSAYMALRRFDVNLRLIFLESLAEAGATIALVALGTGAAGAAFGRAIGYSLGAVLAVGMTLGIVGASVVRLRGSGRTRGIATYAFPLLITNSAYTLYSQIDVLIIGGLLGTTAVGLFSAPARLVMPLTYFGLAIANSVAPRQAGPSPDVPAFQASLRLLIIFQSMIVAPVIVWATPIVHLLFGSDYERSVNVLRLLSLYIFLVGLGPVITTSVNYLGQATRRIPIVLVALGVNTAIDFALVPSIGVAGGAIGTGVAYLLYVPAHFRICRRELGLPLAPLARTLLRSLAAAAAMGTVLFVVGTRTLSPGDWFVGIVGGLLAFGFTLLLTKEISFRAVQREASRTLKAGISRLFSFRQ